MRSLNSITENELRLQFPVIHANLRHFYPLHTKRGFEYDSYKGIIQLDKLIHQKIRNNKNYILLWEQGILRDIQTKMGLRIYGNTLGFVPNYGGIVLLEKDKKDGFSYEMHFYVSLIDSIFSIQILKKCYQNGVLENSWQPECMAPSNLKHLIVSPVPGLFDNTFIELENNLREYFPGARFLPYSIDSLILEGFYALDSTEEFSTIGQAFFRKEVEACSTSLIIGDIHYSMNDMK